MYFGGYFPLKGQFEPFFAQNLTFLSFFQEAQKKDEKLLQFPLKLSDVQAASRSESTSYFYKKH